MGKVIKINIKIILNKRNLDEAPTSYLSQKEEPTILKDSEAICFFQDPSLCAFGYYFV